MSFYGSDRGIETPKKFFFLALVLFLSISVWSRGAEAATGDLYVSAYVNNQVLLYNGSTGASMGAFATAGGLDSPEGLVFGPDGNLYVSSFGTDQVLRYNGSTGAFIDAFVTAGSGGLSLPIGLVFGPDGNLYVSSSGILSNQVLRYNGSTGAFIDAFASGGGLDQPDGLVFGPDGNLYVSSSGPNQVLRYNGSTGAFIDIFASGGGLIDPSFLIFKPATVTTTTLLSSLNPSNFGQSVTFTATVTSGSGTPTGTVTFKDGATNLGTGALDGSGQATFATSLLSVGSHSITAVYGGDANYAGSTSPPLTQMVSYLSPVSVPTMDGWGAVFFMLLAGVGSVYYLRRRGRA